MSTFKTRIEDYIGSVGDDTFLGDALTDTATEVLRALPVSKLGYFSEESSDHTSNGINVNNYKLLSVVRENGTDNEYVECRRVSPTYFRKAQDSNSMFAGTIETPVFTIKNSKVFVFPAPASSPNAVKLETVKFPTVSASASNIDTAGDNEFAIQLEDVVVLGATAKAVQYLMARVKDALPSTPTLAISSISAPSNPSNPSISYSAASLGNAVSTAQDAITAAVDAVATAQDAITAGPTDAAGVDLSAAPTDASTSASSYSGPSAASDSSGVKLTNITQLDTEDTIDDFDGNAIEFDQWWSTTAHLIEGEEDAELAALQISKINSYIDAFKAEVSNARSAMESSIQNARNSVEASIANARNDVSIKTTSMTTQTQASIANASNDTNASITKMRESTGAAISKMRESTNASIVKMQQSTGAAISQMRESTNVNIANAARTLEASIQDYSQEVDNFRAGIQKFSAQISSKINEYSAKIQQYSSQVDRYVREYSWYQDQYARFDAKFKESLQVIIGN